MSRLSFKKKDGSSQTKTKSALGLRRIHSSRLLFSLAVCSLSLVGFGAVAYAVAIPTALMNAIEVAPVFNSFEDGYFTNGSTTDTSADATNGATGEDQTGEETLSTTSAEGASLGSSPLMSSVAFSTIQSITQNANDLSSPTPNEPNSSSGPNSQPTNPDPQPEQPSSGSTSQALSAEIENDIHRHLIACYNEFAPYHDQICQGLANINTTMNSPDPNITHVSASPINPRTLLTKVDRARANVMSYRYNGESVLQKSKWYPEAQKLSTCFNDLVNTCSVLRTVDGFTKKNAPMQLNPHLNSDGRVRYLVQGEERFKTIKL